ncbi:MAG: hypothetical protein KDD55_08595, partial [Bdellovibrionales bacterium]|nr:hypothetical protein [Bdellovibrionales bacterium]
MNTPCKRKRFLPYLRSCILGLMLALSASGIALAQGTITDGDANFVINSSGFDGSPSSNFLVNAADHIFEQG